MSILTKKISKIFCERLKRCDELLAELDPAVADNQRLSRLEEQLSKILEKLQGL